MNRKVKSFTLMEVIIVVIILAILVGMGVPFYMKAAERAKTKDAIAQLKLIQEAEEMRLLELNTYLPCTGNDNCNSVLFLALPTGENPDWDYAVTGIDEEGDGIYEDFLATADRTGSGPWADCQYSVEGASGPPTVTSEPTPEGQSSCP